MTESPLLLAPVPVIRVKGNDFVCGLPVSEDKGILIRIAHGLSVMITRQGDFLCHDPNNNDRAAIRAWWKHSEKRIREWWAESLIANRETEYS